MVLNAAGVTSTVIGENLIAQRVDQIDPNGPKDSHGLYYSDSAEVTGLLANLPSGSPQTITVGNVWTPQGSSCFGGWNLQVVYGYDAYDPAQPASQYRTIYRFAGQIRQFQGDSDLQLALTGLAPQEVGSRAGLVVFEGDAGVGGEQLVYQDPVLGKTTLLNVRDQDKDFWISAAQGSVPFAPYTGGLFINGSAVSYVTPLPTTPGVTSFSLELAATQDSFMFTAAMISVPYADISITKTAVSGDDYQVVRPGEQPRYRITVHNSGQAVEFGSSLGRSRARLCPSRWFGRPAGHWAANQLRMRRTGHQFGPDQFSHRGRYLTSGATSYRH